MSNMTRAPSERKNLPGLGRIFRRGQVYWIAYYRYGTEHRESTHSVNENDAVKLLKKRYGEIASGSVPSSGGNSSHKSVSC